MSCGCQKHGNIIRLQRDTCDRRVVQDVRHFCWFTIPTVLTEIVVDTIAA